MQNPIIRQNRISNIGLGKPILMEKKAGLLSGFFIDKTHDSVIKMLRNQFFDSCLQLKKLILLPQT